MSKGKVDVSSLRDISDNLSLDEIDSIIENVSAGNLSSFLNNEKLNEALEKDAYIINNVATQTGITKSCEHGVKISSIIRHKALKLNETTVLELLDNIIRLFIDNFDSSGKNDNVNDTSHNGTHKSLDFVLLSKYFPSGVLAFSSLSWDNLPLSGLIANETLSVQRQRRSVMTSNPTSYKELDTLVEYEQQLETKERVERIKGLLKKFSTKGPINFWEFVLDKDPETGFNNTCFNLYSLTFLTTNGEVAIFKGKNGEPMIKARNPSDSNTVNFQSIVTGWSYDLWSRLVEKYS